MCGGGQRYHWGVCGGGGRGTTRHVCGGRGAEVPLGVCRERGAEVPLGVCGERFCFSFKGDITCQICSLRLQTDLPCNPPCVL